MERHLDIMVFKLDLGKHRGPKEGARRFKEKFIYNINNLAIQNKIKIMK